MNDLSSDITPASTVLSDDGAPSASGAGTPRTLEEPQSLRDSIAASIKEQSDAIEKDDAAKEAVKAEEKADPKAEKPEAEREAEPEKGEDEKAKIESRDKAESKPEDAPKQEEQPRDDRRPRHPEAPQKFLPRAKELWPNVPNEVKGEVARMVSEHEGEVKAAREFIAPLVKYHQMATQAGTTIHDALDRYVNMEQALRSNPTEGFKALLANMQMQPQQAISHIIKAFGVAPQQLAQHIAQNEREYVAPDVQQQPREDPRISQLQQQLEQERAERMRASVIEPFKANHPRYVELKQDIAFFLASGKIPSNLSHVERLEAAYDMAVRINPASNVSTARTDEGPVEKQSRAVSDLGGTKSIKSAPGSVTPDMEPERGGSIRDILMDEVRRRRVA